MKFYYNPFFLSEFKEIPATYTKDRKKRKILDVIEVKRVPNFYIFYEISNNLPEYFKKCKERKDSPFIMSFTRHLPIKKPLDLRFYD